MASAREMARSGPRPAPRANRRVTSMTAFSAPKTRITAATGRALRAAFPSPTAVIGPNRVTWLNGPPRRTNGRSISTEPPSPPIPPPTPPPTPPKAIR